MNTGVDPSRPEAEAMETHRAEGLAMNRSWGIGPLALVLSLSGCAGTTRQGVATRAPARERVGAKLLAWRGRPAAATAVTAGEGRDRTTPKDDAAATQTASAKAAGAVPAAAAASAGRRDAVSDRVARYFPMFNRGGSATARSEILSPTPDLWAESTRASARSRSRSDDRRKAEPGEEASVLAVAMDVAPGRTTVRPRLAPRAGRLSSQSLHAAGETEGPASPASPVVDPQAETATLPGPVESDPRSGVERTSAEGVLPPSSATPRPDEESDTPPPPDHPSAAPDPKSSRSEAPPPAAPAPAPDEPPSPAATTEKAPEPAAPTAAAPEAPQGSEPAPDGSKADDRSSEPAATPAPEKPQAAQPVAETAPPLASGPASSQTTAPSASPPVSGASAQPVPPTAAGPVAHTEARTGWLRRKFHRLGRHEAKGAHAATRAPLPTPALPSKQMPGTISSAVTTAAGGGRPLVDGPIFPAAYYADPGRSPYYARFDANGRTTAPDAPAPGAAVAPAEADKPSMLSRLVARLRGVSEVDRHPAGCECGKHPRTGGALTAAAAKGAATAPSVGAESRDLAERRDVLQRVVANRLHEPAQR